MDYPMRSQTIPKKTNLVLLALCATFLWGSAYPMVKLGYGAFQVPANQPFSQQLFAGVRFVLAGVLILLNRLCLHRESFFPRKGNWGKVWVISLFCTVLQYVPYYIGLAHTPGVVCSIIGACGVFFTILMGCWVFRMERLTMRKALGCALGFCGVVLISVKGGSLGGGFRLDGEALLLVSAAMSSLATVLMKKYTQSDDPMTLYGWQFLLGGAAMIAIGLLGGGGIHPGGPSAWLLLLYLSFISAGAYGLWGILLRDYPVSRVVIWQFMTPIFGSVLSVLLLGESQALTWTVPLALALVCGGILFVNTGHGEKGQAFPTK